MDVLRVRLVARESPQKMIERTVSSPCPFIVRRQAPGVCSVCHTGGVTGATAEVRRAGAGLGEATRATPELRFVVVVVSRLGDGRVCELH